MRLDIRDPDVGLPPGEGGRIVSSDNRFESRWFGGSVSAGRFRSRGVGGGPAREVVQSIVAFIGDVG